MSLHKALTDYLSLRRSLGFKLHSDGQALATFVEFLDKNKNDHITTVQAICWAKLTSSNRPSQVGKRLCYVRGFASYLRAFDDRTEIPPTDLFPSKHQRPTPYLFTDTEISRLVKAAGQLPGVDTMLRHSLSCLFGLLSVTGLRISEALNLSVENVDLESGILTISGAKFGKTRLIPLHSSTVSALTRYRDARQQFLQARSVDYWFVNQQANPLGYECVRSNFRKLLKLLDIDSKAGHPRPRLHALRHHFAVATLTRWYKNGVNVDGQLPVLSAYLGHVETRDTYWYITACPNLMNMAKDRLEKNTEAST